MGVNKHRIKSLAEQIAELDDPAPKDFDPEDLSDHDQSSDHDQLSDDDRESGLLGREHYETVGKSKLRVPAPVELGLEYAGSRVSRDVLNASDSEGDAMLSADTEGSDTDMSDDEDQEGDDSPGNDNTGDSDQEDGKGEDESVTSIESDTEDDAEEESPRRRKNTSHDRDEVRRLMATDDKVVALSLSQAAEADASKGIAVRQQRRTFDALLNSRIRLQKSFSFLKDVNEPSHEQLIKSTEAAAISLWNTLDDLRHALATSTSGDTSESVSKKRKRTPISSSTPSSEIWGRMNDLESQAVPHRRAVLEKWSLKARGIRAAIPSNQNKLLTNKSNQQTITAVLDAHIATETAHLPDARPPNILYDDTAFYQSLLRDLVEQRMSSTTSAGIDSQLSGLAIHPTSGMRKDKVKREVDTKASKGRKMKFNVHEKLQNFMAPEERGAWGDRAREEFFASLLGRRAREVLEEDEEDEENEMSEGDGIEEDGLRLFRS
ncbi:rRNA-processing protein bfr2 [Ophidiomyces ophidiicola]|nr:rRNA-processing protein bfr2 [Ophidiomyces ophidiicola]